MKKLLTAICLAAALVGCNSNNGEYDSRMSYDDMHNNFKEALSAGYRCMVDKRDSAFYYAGKMDAFYECMYNKK